MPEVKEPKTYDLVIIGAGPAGMTAAVYSARKKISTLLISQDVGGQVLMTADIENYMGFQFVTGKELTEKFYSMTRDSHLVQSTDQVARVKHFPPHFQVDTQSGQSYLCWALIVASGKRPRTLNVPGERKLTGRGVSYCAVMDGTSFEGQEVAVVGGGNSALQAVCDLCQVARKVHVVSLYPWKADPITCDKVNCLDNIEIHQGYTVSALRGNDCLEAVEIESPRNRDKKWLQVSAVFVEIGLVPNSEFIQGVLKVNQWGEIPVNMKCETEVPGLFAAGDVTDVPEKQIIVAAGEGAKAALAAYDYLQKVKT
jgi:alkyl hydroperoxide reductase subunit F